MRHWDPSSFQPAIATEKTHRPKRKKREKKGKTKIGGEKNREPAYTSSGQAFRQRREFHATQAKLSYPFYTRAKYIPLHKNLQGLGPSREKTTIKNQAGDETFKKKKEKKRRSRKSLFDQNLVAGLISIQKTARRREEESTADLWIGGALGQCFWAQRKPNAA